MPFHPMATLTTWKEVLLKEDSFVLKQLIFKMSEIWFLPIYLDMSLFFLRETGKPVCKYHLITG